MVDFLFSAKAIEGTNGAPVVSTTPTIKISIFLAFGVPKVCWLFACVLASSEFSESDHLSYSLDPPYHLSPSSIPRPLPSIVPLPFLKLTILPRVAPEPFSFIHHPFSMVPNNGFPVSGWYGIITAHVQHRPRVSITEKLPLDTMHSWHLYHDSLRATLQVPAIIACKLRREQGSAVLSYSHRPPPCRFPQTWL